MRKPATFRLDPDVLEKARRLAKADNRTLTNFIETLLKSKINSSEKPDRPRRSKAS